MSRRQAKVEMWPSAAVWRDGKMHVTQWSRKPGKEPEPEQPTSRRGVAAQGAFDL